jgi:hypothetical protein
MAREITNKILEMVENEILDRDIVIAACLKYMSEDEVHDMAEINEFLECTEVDLDDDFDYKESDVFGFYEDEDENY